MNAVMARWQMTAPDATSLVNDERTVLLRVRNLQKSFGGQMVIANGNFTLRRGEVVLFRGVNGSGKTTVLNLLSGNLVPDAGEICLEEEGRTEVFRFPVPWWYNLNPWNHFTPERLAQLGVVRSWQDVRLAASQSLENNIVVAASGQRGENPLWAILKRSRVQQQEARLRKAAQLKLADLGLAGREESLANAISLGQSRRVEIARAVQADARILFLDEPLAGLDTAGVQEVMRWLTELVREQRLTLVIVEHVFNIPYLLNLVTTVWTLEQGALRLQKPEEVREELTQLTRGQEQGWLHQLAGVKENVQSHPLIGGAILSVSGQSRQDSAPVLEVEDLVVYRGQRLVVGERTADGTVKGISFSLWRGQLGVLEAPNGWGKTTLLEAIAGIIPVSSGSIWIDGRLIEGLPMWQRVKLGLALLQSRDNIFPNLLVKEMLKLARVVKIPPGLQKLLGKRMSDLSGGERQRVVLACFQRKLGIVQMLDEPFSALDIAGVRDFLNMVKPDEGRACLIALPLSVFGGL
ncbi:ATP-binding protein of ABC transporter (plasmid) [Nostoc carneum NIES-2107]|nr:ATP-binding protein of ABC transporter [Nostoc carneum NIES-2107]